MSIFSFFRKSEWKKLKVFPTSVQQDIAHLIALDSLVKTVVASRVEQLQVRKPVDLSRIRARIFNTLSNSRLIHEIQLAALSTGVGKKLSAISWSLIPPFRSVAILGILAMCEYRNAEQLTVENDLKHSGYSAYPDEARTQLLILMANEAGVDDLEEMRTFDTEVFREFWIGLRRTIFVDIELSVCAEPAGLSPATKERFKKLSAPRKEILFLIAESLAKRKDDSVLKQEKQKSEQAPFNLAQNKMEHPFKYVPYQKLIDVMECLSLKTEQFFGELFIDSYEIGRIIGAKQDATEALLSELISLDADTAAYCIVVSQVTMMEVDFVGCGVWKKLTEDFENKNMKRFTVAAKMMTARTIADTKSNFEGGDSNLIDLVLNLIQEIRRSPRDYLEAIGDDVSRLSRLLAGTMVLKHVLNHPRFKTTLCKFLIESINSLDPILEEIKSGELKVNRPVFDLTPKSWTIKL